MDNPSKQNAAPLSTDMVEGLQRRIHELGCELKDARNELDRSRKFHGEASQTAYRLAQENEAMIVTIRVLSEQLAKWKT